MNIRLSDIAQMVGGELIGEGSVHIHGCSGIDDAKTGDITFIASEKYAPLAQKSNASVFLIPRQMALIEGYLTGKSFIRVDNPSFSFTTVLNHFINDRPSVHPTGINPTAIIAQDAVIGKNVAIGAYTIVESRAVIGDGTIIYGHCYIGHGSRVGGQCLIYPNVVLRDDITIGERVVIHSGTVIGCDGYGYVTVDGRHVKIPQIGTVIIENDVEIGANVTIDRARFDKTVVGEGTKIDNLVHIAHNVIIGKHCLIVAQVGISGSSKIGNYVILAGQVGIVGHLTIGDGAIITAQSGVSKSIKAGEQVFGTPCQPLRQAFRNNAHIQRLDQYVETIKDLKKRIEELEKK